MNQYDIEKHFSGTKAVRSSSNSFQGQPLKATDGDCVGSRFVVELPKLINLTLPVSVIVKWSVAFIVIKTITFSTRCSFFVNNDM